MSETAENVENNKNEHTHTHRHSGEKVRHRYDLGENMLLLSVITFAAGTFCYEKYMPESFMKVYRALIFAICIFMWLYLSLKSGYRNKWKFEIFSVIFWIVPLIEIYISYNGPEFCRRSTALYVLSEFFTIMYITPAETLGSAFNINGTAAVIVMALICSFVFLAGTLLPDNMDNIKIKKR